MIDELELEQQINGDRENGETSSSLDGVTVNETGFCTLCGKTSVCKCERCGDFYCSPFCQRKDWPNHRFICFPLPRLVKAGGQQTHDCKDNDVPNLKSEIKLTSIVKEENRQSFKARQLGFSPISTAVPESGSCVILTGFKSSNRCYIRSANPTITEEYQKVLKRIDHFGKSSKDLNSTPKSNTFALTQRNDKWCRVQILSAKPENRIRVQFIDFGVTSTCNLRELRRISQAMAVLPCYVNMVNLNGITKYSQDTNLLQKLSQFSDKEFKIQFIKEDELKGNVKLYHWGTEKLLNSEILSLCVDSNGKEYEMGSNSSSLSNNDVNLSKTISKSSKSFGGTDKSEIAKVSSTSANTKEDIKYESGKVIEKTNLEISPVTTKKRNLSSAPRQIQIQKPCLEPPFETVPLDTKDRNFKVYVVDCAYIDHGYIGCLLEKYCDNLKSITKFLNEYMDNGQSYKPKLNEYCLAQYENEWYRAKVIEVLGEDKYQVVYIDFSNELQLTSEGIRRYPMSLTLPCCTSLCAIEGLPVDLCDEAIKFIRKKYDFQKLTIDRVKIEEGITFVESKELLKVLHEEKLI